MLNINVINKARRLYIHPNHDIAGMRRHMWAKYQSALEVLGLQPVNNNTGPIIRINMTTTVHHNPWLDYSTIITVVLYHQASFDSNLNRHLSIHLLVKSDNVNIVEGDVECRRKHAKLDFKSSFTAGKAQYSTHMHTIACIGPTTS